MERINKCISQLAFNFETLWFLDVLYSINIEVLDAKKCPVPTACVTFRDFKINMFFNREFIDKLNDDELLGLILHETLHLTFYHNVRNVDKNMQLWNIACDLEVNSIIDSMKFKLPEGGLLPQKDFKLPTRLSAEQYYDAIYRELEEQAKNGKFGQGSGNGIPIDIENLPTLDDHSQWSKTESESEMVKQMMDTVVKSAIQKNEKDLDKSSLKDNLTEALRDVNGKNNKSHRHGSELGNYVSTVTAKGEGKVKWNFILNRLIRKTLSSNYIPSFKRTSRRYGELVKGKIKNHKIDNIIVAVDTSGNDCVEVFSRRYVVDNTGISTIENIKASAGSTYVQLTLISANSKIRLKRKNRKPRLPKTRISLKESRMLSVKTSARLRFPAVWLIPQAA